MKKKLGKMEEEKKRLEAEEKIKVDAAVEAAARASAAPTRPAVRSL